MDVDNAEKRKKAKDRVTQLCELRRGLVYHVVAQYGTNDYPRFVINVDVDGEVFQGVGPSRKRAKTMAAEQGLVRLAVLSAFDVEKPEPETYLKDDFTADVFNSSGLFYQFTERDPGVQTYPSNIPSLTSLDFGLDEEECDEYANFIGRNSVSILSELRQDASYRLVYSSNNVKTPKFVMTCKLDGQMFRGEAPSKKLAKARAARDALQELFGIEFSHVEDGMPVYEGNGNVWQNYKSKLEQESFKLVGTFEAKNPIAQLHEIFTDIQYEFGEAEEGHFFPCKVKANGEEFDGIGRSKKEAKANAAANALESLRVSGFLEKWIQEKESKKKAKVEKLKETEKAKTSSGLAQTRLNKWLKLAANPAKNAVAKLHELYPTCEYSVVGEMPMRNSVITAFAVSVKVNHRTYIGIGKNKKLAKMDAAEKALQGIGMWTEEDDYMKLYALRGDRQLENAWQSSPDQVWGGAGPIRPDVDIRTGPIPLLRGPDPNLGLAPGLMPPFRGRNRPGYDFRGRFGRGGARGRFGDESADVYQNEFHGSDADYEWGEGVYGFEEGYEGCENEQDGHNEGNELDDYMIDKLSTIIARYVAANPNAGPQHIWNSLQSDDSWQTGDWPESEMLPDEASRWQGEAMYEPCLPGRGAGVFGGGQKSIMPLMSEAGRLVVPLMGEQRPPIEPLMGKAGVQPLLRGAKASVKPLMGKASSVMPLMRGLGQSPRMSTAHQSMLNQGCNPGFGGAGFSSSVGRGRGASFHYADEELNACQTFNEVSVGFGDGKSSGRGFVNRRGMMPPSRPSLNRGAMGFSMGRDRGW